MRVALVALMLLVATGCGATVRHAQSRAADVAWPPVAEATRAQWYRSVEHGEAAPVTLSRADLELALRHGAEAVDADLLRMHYLPLLGGTAELVVQPREPVRFAEAGTGITTLLGPLGRDQRPYLVTVVDEQQRPLLLLGWTPSTGREIGEGIAWQADGLHSATILGQPVISKGAAAVNG